MFTSTGSGETVTGTFAAEVINALGGADWIELAGGNDMLSLSQFGESPGRVGGQFRVYPDMETGVSENYNGTERIEFTNIERLTSTIFTDLVRGTDGDDFIRTLGDYDGDLANYTLTRTAAKTVTIAHATEGTDTFISVEYFEFANQTVDVWSLRLV